MIIMPWFRYDDMRYGLRLFRKSPGWAAVLCATLTLGIGLTTAIFSLFYGVFLRALPYPEPERLVALWNNSTSPAAAGMARLGVCSADWVDWRAQSKSFEDIALTTNGTNFNLTGDGRPERVRGAQTSWNLPQVVGIQPLLGRFFTETETNQNSKVAVLSYRFWDRRLARDPAVVGRNILLDGVSFEVIGILPPGFQYPSLNNELLTPLFIPPNEIQSRMAFHYSSVGRLKPGVSLRQAQAEMSAIMRRLAQQHTANSKTQRGVLVEPLLEGLVGQFRTTLYVLIAAVGCLLLIVCTNLSGMLIVRANARTHEFAVRAALGASAACLRRQTLAEVLPLSIVGAGGGALFAWGLLKMLKPWLPAQLSSLESIGLHGPVVAFASVISVLVTLCAGMVPARLASRMQLTGTMQQSSRTVVGGNTIRNVLVAAQIAITLVLVFAGSLLVRSLVAVTRVNPGFSTQGVLTMQMQVPRAKYPTNTQVVDYYRRLVAQVKALPGVIEASMVTTLPFSGTRPYGPVEFEGKTDRAQVGANFISVTPGYFSAMGIPLLHGRDFSEHDVESAPLVGIIDDQLARKVFGSADPLGKRFRFGAITDSTPWVEIVGVVGHIRMESLETDVRQQLYWPRAQPRPEPALTQYRGTLVVKTSDDPELFASTVAEQILKENPDQPVYDVRSMGSWLDQSLQLRNLLTGLVTLFSGSALLLACIGLYGVVSYAAGLRLREFAIRTALGARPGDVRWLVFTHALRPWIWGSAVGLAAAWPVGNVLKSHLYGVGNADAVSLVVALALLLITALLASLDPARRVGRINPAVTLHTD
jgi:putative ABC transport system permease protein